MKILMTLLLATFLALFAFAQDAPKPVDAVTPLKSVPGKLPPEFDQAKLEIQNFILRKAVAERDYQIALQTLAASKKESDDYTTKAKAAIDAVYKKLDIKIEEFDINFETGEIIPAAVKGK